MEKKLISAEGINAEIYLSDNMTSPLVVLVSHGDEWEEVFDKLKKMDVSDFTLASVRVNDWNNDLSPWPAEPVAKWDTGYAGGADRFLGILEERLIPDITASSGITPIYTAVAGYSLGGLFSLYSLCRTDIFKRVASVSGSLWYPGFSDYMKKHGMVRKPERIIMSLGDREKKTKNMYLKTVEEKTLEVKNFYEDCGIDVSFRFNPGNHFTDPAGRTADAVAEMIRED